MIKKDKKNIKKTFILVLILCLTTIVFIQSSLARYIYNGIHNFILESQGFYFNSSILNINNPKYQIYNWDGVNSYSLNIDVNSKKNDSIWTLADIDYNIAVSCPENINCSVTKNYGIIYESDKMDSFVVTVTPTKQVEKGESIEVKISATSKSPYKKELSATYIIGVETAKFSYSIEDSVGSKYLVLKLKNSVSFYEVINQFSNYNVGDIISLDDYNNLTEEEKKNCFSAKVSLTYDSNDIYLDMTDKTYLNKIEGSVKTKQFNNYTYISGHSFYVGANSNTEILFYKKDINKDYTYPLVNKQSIIDVQSIVAS